MEIRRPTTPLHWAPRSRSRTPALHGIRHSTFTHSICSSSPHRRSTLPTSLKSPVIRLVCARVHTTRSSSSRREWRAQEGDEDGGKEGRRPRRRQSRRRVGCREEGQQKRGMPGGTEGGQHRRRAQHGRCECRNKVPSPLPCASAVLQSHFSEGDRKCSGYPPRMGLDMEHGGGQSCVHRSFCSRSRCKGKGNIWGKHGWKTGRLWQRMPSFCCHAETLHYRTSD